MTAVHTIPKPSAEVPAAEPHRRRGRYDPTRRRSNMVTVLMWLCALYFVLPLIWLIVASTKDTGDLFSTFGLWFGERAGFWCWAGQDLHGYKLCTFEEQP